MSLYRALYEGNPSQKARPDEPMPTGLKLLWMVLREDWWKLIKLNILFWVFCLPVVTIPAALKAMTRVCVLLLRGESCWLWEEWWKGFKGQFLCTTAVGAGTGLALLALGYGVSSYGRAMAENGLLAVPALLLALAAAWVLMALFSLFPLLEFSELSLSECLRSAFLLVLVRLPQNLAVLLAGGAMAVLYLLFYPYSSYVLAAAALSVFWLIACFAAWPGLKKYVFHMN